MLLCKAYVCLGSLEGGLKRKIEVQWSNITSLNASFLDNEPCVTLQEAKHLRNSFHEICSFNKELISQGLNIIVISLIGVFITF